MTNETKLVLVKLLHTAVWWLMVAATAYALWASLVDRIDGWFFACIGLIVAEVAVLVARRFKCPLTSVAERYTDARDPAFDIYLPSWVAKHNVRIFSVVFVVSIVANVVVRLRP